MSHARTQIEVEMLTALQFPGTMTVQAGRVYIYTPQELPIVGLYTNEETQSLDDGSFDAIGRELNLVCEIVAQGTSGQAVNDSLNDIASLIETTLGQERQALGILDCVPSAWAAEITTEGETVTGKGVIEFSVLYQTAIGSPDTII